MDGKWSRTYWIENALILVAIVLLWPRIFLGWSGPVWFAVECVMLVIMAVICIRRLKAVHRWKD